MQGLGNDFVVLEGPVSLEQADIVALCDRRRGVGADGVLVVTADDPIEMGYWNADGSPAEMCGNGLRCIARYAHDRGWVRDPEFAVQTPVGLRRVRVLDDGVEAEIGTPSVTGHTTFEGERLHLIDVGNPHAVVVVDDPSEVDVPTLGEAIGTDSQFPTGSNVEFMKVDAEGVTMRVWERGVGETSACGTGMVAAAFVATKTNKLDGSITVNVPGGQGQVEIRDGTAWLKGPADYSFRGSVEGR